MKLTVTVVTVAVLRTKTSSYKRQYQLVVKERKLRLETVFGISSSQALNSTPVPDLNTKTLEVGITYLAMHSLWEARPAVYGMSTGIQPPRLITLFLVPIISNCYCYCRAGCSDQRGRGDSDWWWCNCRCGSRGSG